MGKAKFKQTISRLMKDEARNFFSSYQNNKTRSRYLNNYFKFIEFCRREYSCKTKEECTMYIQEYERYLEKQGFTASTIHNKLAPVCIYHNVNLNEIKKPKRSVSEYTRGRLNNRKTTPDSDMENPRYARSIQFQKRVGIRRNELRKLTGNDFVMDESGKPCVRVKRGKGGKSQLQRILPDDVGFVREYFKDKKPDERIFGPKEISGNNINYHYLRAKQAQRAYQYYQDKLSNEVYREQLKKEIQKRSILYRKNSKTGKPMPISENELFGFYWLRGKNKQFALKNNMPLKYDRLAVMAVSVFHLSHWRCDVTIASYLLVV